MRRLVLTGLAALLLISTASASELGVEEIQFESPVYGGQTVEKDFSLSWNGQTDTVAHINASVEGGSENGVNLSLAENPVIVPADGETEATLILSADYFVEPENFTVNVEASTNVEKEVEYRDSDSGGGGGTIVIDSDEEEGQSEEESNESDEGNSSEIDRLRDRLDESDSENKRLRERIESLENNASKNNSDSATDDVEETEQSYLLLILLLALGLIGFIVYIVFFYFTEDENSGKSFEFKEDK